MPRQSFRPLKVFGFVGDLRLVGPSGEHDAIAADLPKLMSFLDDWGVRYHAKGVKRWWATRVIRWLGLVVDSNVGEVKMEERKVLENTKPAPGRGRASPRFHHVAFVLRVPLLLLVMGGPGWFLPLSKRLEYCE